MTTFLNENTRCAMCGQSSEHTSIGSTNSMGSPDLDLRPPPMKRHTMSVWIQECPHCHHIAPNISSIAGSKTDFDSADYKAILADEQFPELARRFLAYAYLVTKSSPDTAGRALLHAAWVCDDAYLKEAAATCRIEATTCFLRDRPLEDSEAGATKALVVIDALRRAGRFEQAESECNVLSSYANAVGLLRNVLEYQRRLIARRDDAAHTVAETSKNV